METTHGKTHSENGEGECWWSRINVDFLFKVKEEKGGKCWLLESLPPNGWNHTLVGARPVGAHRRRL